MINKSLVEYRDASVRTLYDVLPKAMQVSGKILVSIVSEAFLNLNQFVYA